MMSARLGGGRGESCFRLGAVAEELISRAVRIASPASGRWRRILLGKYLKNGVSECALVAVRLSRARN